MDHQLRAAFPRQTHSVFRDSGNLSCRPNQTQVQHQSRRRRAHYTGDLQHNLQAWVRAEAELALDRKHVDLLRAIEFYSNTRKTHPACKLPERRVGTSGFAILTPA